MQAVLSFHLCSKVSKITGLIPWFFTPQRRCFYTFLALLWAKKRGLSGKIYGVGIKIYGVDTLVYGKIRV